MSDNKQGPRIDRRGVLECMIWAGTGVIWTLSGGVPKSSQFHGIGTAQAAEKTAAGFSFLQISDSHVGFSKPANPDAPGTLKEAIDKVHSKALDTDDSFSFTFAKAGTYGYFCGLHPQMQGKIIVTP